MMTTKIAILGCGTVGGGLMKLLVNYPEIEPVKIFVKDLNKKRDLDPKYSKYSQSIFTTNINEILNDKDIQIIVELMGGVGHTKDILLEALKKGKNIVTANKDLLALEGEELFEAAKKYKKTILFEAAVAGGIPIISTLKQSLRGNKIHSLLGIINGTTNYILDLMESKTKSFAEALKDAQELGFAESDPSNDVDGYDAAYKIAILASIISGKRIDFKQIFCEGIRNITIHDIRSAAKRGYRIKLLGIINNPVSDDLDLRVHPVFVPLDNPLASVTKENNALLIYGDAVQNLTLIGKGAGSLPTASSVLGDILTLSSQLAYSNQPHPQYVCKHSEYAKIKNIDDVKNAFYIRIAMFDHVGVLEGLGHTIAHYQANVKFMDQYNVTNGEALADFIIDPIEEKVMKHIVEDMKRLNFIKSVESVIRIL